MDKKYKNSYKVIEKELVSLSVYNVGFQKCDSLYQWGPGIRDHYLIHYVVSGQGYYKVGSTTYELHAGDAFLVYPNTEVLYYADKINPWEYAWVGFAGSDASMILNATDFSKQMPLLRQIPLGASIHEYILKIYEARGNRFENALEMTGYLYTMLSLFIRQAKEHTVSDTASAYVKKSVEFILANYSYQITVEDIARYVGVSRSHLFRSFQTVLNCSPKEYLTDFRMRQACNLLERSDLSITAIANSVGFDNSLYFSKTFRKEKGISPKAFRKMHRNLREIAGTIQNEEQI